MNDESLGMVKIWEKLFFDERYTATDNPTNPYYTELADSYNIHSTYCGTKNNLDIVMQSVLAYNGPVVCEFKVQTEECFPLVPPGKALDDMILYNEHIENLKEPPS
jgi:acetolactate synthase-1/2/3 large subunit